MFRHDLRTSFTEDKVVFGEDRSAEAHYELAMSDDGRSLVITGSVDGGGSDVHLYRIDTGEFTAVAEGLRSRFRTVVVRGNMFLWTDHGAQRGRVLRAPLDSLPGRVDDWPELVPERAYPLREVYFGRNAMVAHYLEDLQSRAELLDYDTGRTVGVLDLPKLSTLDGVRANPRSADFFYGVTTLLGPTTIYRYDAGRAESTRYDSFVDRQLGQPQRGTSGRERQAGGLAGALTAVPDRIAWVRVVLPGLARGAVAYAVAVEAFIRLIDQPNGPYGRLLHRAMWLLDDGADLLEVIDEGLDDLDAARLQVAADRLGQVLARLYQTVPATNPDVAGLTSQQSSPVGPTVGDISFPASRLHTTKIFPHQVSALMLASSPRKPFEYNDPNRSVYVPMADAARAYYRPDVVRALNHVAIEVGITDLHFQIEHQLLSELDPAEVVEMHTGIGYTYQSVRIRAALMSVLGPRLATLKGIPPRRTP